MTSQDKPISLLSMARIALKNGFVPIPIVGKAPKLGGWQNITSDQAMAKIEYAKKRGMVNNIGILTGEPSSIVVVDVDANRNGLQYWQQLLQEYSLPLTFTVKTGGNGYHYYFDYDERTSQLRNAKDALNGNGIDLKTTGGQVVFPGSHHPETGKMYLVEDGQYDDGTLIIASMPDWLYQMLKENQDRLNLKYRRY